MRKCSICGNLMSEGYINENTGEYFCSDDCLNKTYTKEEIKELQLDNEEDEEMVLYWTTWDECNEDLSLLSKFLQDHKANEEVINAFINIVDKVEE